MKMVECMEDEGLFYPKVKSEIRSFRNIMPTNVMEAKARTNANGAKVSWGLMMTKRKCSINN
jgi:hypothetical protein